MNVIDCLKELISESERTTTIINPETVLKCMNVGEFTKEIFDNYKVRLRLIQMKGSYAELEALRCLRHIGFYKFRLAYF